MITNDLDGCYIVFDTKTWDIELNTLINKYWVYAIDLLGKLWKEELKVELT